MLGDPALKPYPKDFPDLLADYCQQIGTAKSKNWHHDQRRALFMDFLRKSFFIEVSEVELEHKVKVAQVRGYIDALYSTTIFEFKTDIERERATGLSELKTYFLSRPDPNDYIAVLTDGETFELYLWADGKVERIDSFRLLPEKPLEGYLKLDQFYSSEKPRQPTSSDIVISFGSESAAYRKARTLMTGLHERVSKEPAVATKFREWNRLLSKVYGSELGYADLFITHTYLVVLSRLMVAQALFPRQKRDTNAYRGLMSGEYFVRQNLPNLAEPDFFSWALDTSVEGDFVGLIGQMEKHVGKYKFGSTGEDVLKELYQELVDPSERHELGEYYTPDWLADLTLDRIGYQGGTLLDPSCGSGTFLMAAVRRLRAIGLQKKELVEAISRDLSGIDVHPLAVLMAKANILLALGADARGHTGQIRLPVFMADTLQTELDESGGSLRIPAAAGHVFHLPLASIERAGDELDNIIEEMHHFAQAAADSGGSTAAAKTGFINRVPLLQDAAAAPEIPFWRHNLDVAAKLIREKKNSVWGFILKNAYRPLFIRKRRVDYVVGNPPWLSYRYIKDPAYKKRVRDLATELGLADRSTPHLLTQLDLSTIFYRFCEKEFLSEGGKMGMVLPRSVIIGAKQHASFQQQGGFSKILDCQGVQHLFNVPACVLLRLERVEEGRCIPCELLEGSLDSRNLPWEKAKRSLFIQESSHEFVVHHLRSPWYRDIALQGASLFPRAFWFVELDPKTSQNPEVPYLRTSEETLKEAKDPWKKHRVSIRGQVESQFLFFTVLAKGLVPFGLSRREVVFLPIRRKPDGTIGLLGASTLLEEGHRCASTWLQNAQNLWLEHRSEGNLRSITDWIDYNGKLTSQSLTRRHVVLFNASGTNLTAACVDTSPDQIVDGVRTNGFVSDSKTYYLYLDSLRHADYLCAILNSETVMQAVKETMPRGLMGERDIHRRPFEVCEIPEFDKEVQLHQEIAALGRRCRIKAAKVVEKIEGRLGRARQEMRQYLEPEIGDTDRLVAGLLNRSGKQEPTKGRVIRPGEMPFF